MKGATAIRLALLVDALGWAVVLGAPWPTFPLSRAYDGLAAVASESTWAGLFAALAVALALTWTARWPRVAVTFAVGALHVFLALSFAHSSHWGSTGTPTHAAVVLLAWWLLGEDAAEARRGG